MKVVLSRAQIRDFDRHAIEKANVPSVVLMENAGRGAAEAIAELSPRRTVVLCGSGNNGGDGFVVARRLALLGHAVDVVLTSSADKLGGDAKLNHRAYLGLFGPVHEAADEEGVTQLVQALAQLSPEDVIVDALLGTGLDRDVEGRLATLIAGINDSPARCVALDIPSGLDCDTGRVLGVAVRADRTVTFAQPKLGLFSSVGVEHTGVLRTVDIGVPASLHEQVGHSAVLVERRRVVGWLEHRSRASHKNTAGHVVAVAGSAGKLGAALLVARGALRGGAGLCTVCTFADAADRLDSRVLEEMTARIDPARLEASLDAALERASVVAIGPGLGLDADAKRVVEHVVLGHPGPVVVDADALTHFAGRADQLKGAPGPRLLTPHPGELGRLLACSARDVEADRFGALARIVDRTGAVVVLKGPRTLVGAPDELPTINTSGTPALGTAGAGDVLTGLTAALACGLSPQRAAITAAFIHGLAAERWAASVGDADRGLLAHEVADAAPGVLAELLAR